MIKQVPATEVKLAAALLDTLKGPLAHLASITNSAQGPTTTPPPVASQEAEVQHVVPVPEVVEPKPAPPPVVMVPAIAPAALAVPVPKVPHTFSQG